MASLKRIPQYLQWIQFPNISLFFGNLIVLFFNLLEVIFYSDVIGAEMLANEGSKKIGGPGITVEIDESMFGKRRVCEFL